MGGGGGEGGKGRLWVVASPIGNLRDVTLRALDVLREADLVVAEDTRRARILLGRHGIEAAVTSLPAFDEVRRIGPLLGRLRTGASVALLTDAGMPSVSDPGGRLVAAARSEGVAVEVLPGPSAVTAAVAASGLPALPFRFLGFLPRKGARRRRALASVAADPGASVFFEAPGRLVATLEDLAEVLSAERRLAVCRELTKRFEEVAVGSAEALRARFDGGVRGEVTVVVEATADPFGAGAGAAGPRQGEGASEAARKQAAMRAALDRLRTGERTRDVARALARELSCSRREAYQRLLEARASEIKADDGQAGVP